MTLPHHHERKQVAILATDEKISKLTTKKSRNTLGLRNKIISEELETIHNKFVVLPIGRIAVMLPLSVKDTVLKF